eukprot:3931614-Rhodomonas_salina.2
MVWEVLIPQATGDPSIDFSWADVDVDATTAEIATRLSALGYNVNIDLVSLQALYFGITPSPAAATPSTTTVTKTGSDAVNRKLLIALLAAVGGLVLMLFGGCYWLVVANEKHELLRDGRKTVQYREEYQPVSRRLSPSSRGARRIPSYSPRGL